MPGFLTNNLPTMGQIAGYMRIPLDTEFPRGMNPASIAGSALQVAGVLAECMMNQSTEAGGTAAGTSFGGMTVTGALSGAPGVHYVLTLTNPLITQEYINAGGVPEAGIYSGSNTGGSVPPLGMTANMTMLSTVPSVGQVVFTWRNDGDSALNGTMVVVWHL
jgi:hypothetical protein